MFLFTTPPAPSTTRRPPSPVVDAIRQGAERTGTGFDYLLATAQRESALDPSAARAIVVGQRPLPVHRADLARLVKCDGPRLGLGQQANAIQTRPDGTHVVSDPAARQAILDLRQDPKVASVMAGTFTQRNRETPGADLGREPSAGDLYAAHFLGARGAAQLIQHGAAVADPAGRRAISRTPRPPTAASSTTAAAGRAAPARSTRCSPPATPTTPGATAAPAFAPDRPLAFASKDGPAFHGLFQTETRRGPISEAVAKLWRGGEGNAERGEDGRARLLPENHALPTRHRRHASPARGREGRVRDLPLPACRPALSEAAPAPASAKPAAGRAHRSISARS